MFGQKNIFFSLIIFFGCFLSPLSFAVQEIIIPPSPIVISPDQNFSLRDATEGLDYLLVEYDGQEKIENSTGVVIQNSKDVVVLTKLSDALSDIQQVKKLAFAEIREDELIVHDMSDFKVRRISYNSDHTELIFKRDDQHDFYAALPRVT